MFRHIRAITPHLVLLAILLASIWTGIGLHLTPEGSPGLLIGAVLSGLALLVTAWAIRAQQQGLDASTLVQSALAHAEHGVIAVDPSGTVQLLTPRAVALLGLPSHLAQPGVQLRDILDWQLKSGEFAGPNAAEAGAAPPGLVPVPRPDIAALAQSSHIQPARYERIRRNGVVLDITINTLPEGGIVCSYADITDRKRGEAELTASWQAELESLDAQSQAQEAFLADLDAPMRDLFATAGEMFDAGLPQQIRPLAAAQLASLSHLARTLNGHLTDPAFDASGIDRRLLAYHEERQRLPVPAPATPTAVRQAPDFAIDDDPAPETMANSFGTDETAGLLAAFAEEAGDCIVVLRGHEAARFWEARTAEAEGLTETATSMGFAGMAALARQIAELPEGTPGSDLIEALDAMLAEILAAQQP